MKRESQRTSAESTGRDECWCEVFGSVLFHCVCVESQSQMPMVRLDAVQTTTLRYSLALQLTNLHVKTSQQEDRHVVAVPSGPGKGETIFALVGPCAKGD